MEFSSYRGAQFETKHQFVTTKLRGKLCIANRKTKGYIEQQIIEFKRLNNPSIKAGYQLELSNKFNILAGLRRNSRTTNSKPWFDEECLMLHEERQQAGQQ